MRNSRDENIIQSKEEAYQVLSNIRFLYQKLSSRHREVFLKSLKKNPIRKILESECLKTSQIYNNYEAFKNYFIYLTNGEEEELYFIRKDDVTQVAKNLKVSFKNDWKTDKKHLLN